LKKQTQASAFVTFFFMSMKKKNDSWYFVKPVQTIEGKQHEKIE